MSNQQKVQKTPIIKDKELIAKIKKKEKQVKEQLKINKDETT